MSTEFELSDNFQWLENFKSIHGHPPRVLHIGNIANNAYNNANILRECGLEGDVICYDYYHNMATPEWEDADFTIEGMDQFNPNWSSINLGKFKRPKWFVQGPMSLCIDYLIAKNRGDKMRSDEFWHALAQLNKTRQQNLFAKSRYDLKKYLRLLKYFFINQNANLRIRSNNFFSEKQPNSLLFYIYFIYLLTFLPLFFIAKIFVWLGQLILGLLNEYSVHSDKFIDVWKMNIQEKFINLDSLAPGISFENLEKDLGSSVNLKSLGAWKSLFSYYDVVIGYSTDGIYPLLTDTPYIAFEHGTIRDIPYQDTSQGRLCAITYAAANHVFVTNFDCKKSAEFLAPNKYTLINHPFDENHSHGIVGVDSLREKLLQELDSDFLFFFPTRHDWVKGTGYADKANNVFLNAFTKLRQLGFRVGAVCCEWGQNVENSKKLLSDSRVDNYVKWSDPMATVQFERTAMACDCVVDQFKLGSFGGILFKAMAAGSPVMTYLKEEMLKEQFSEMPPVINCKNETDIIKAIKSFYEKPDSRELLGQKSRDWINRHHSKRDTINKQLEQFKILLQK